MPDEIRVGRGPAMSHSDSMSSESHMHRRGKGSSLPWIILIIVITVLAVLGILFRESLFSGAKDKNASDYQAIFLTNGQVYFGKMSSAHAKYVTLKDIFYLQVTQPALQGSQQTPTQAQAQPQLQLVKLGNELHGPIDEMKINRDQILFFEDMKTDGKVVQAIEDYKKNPNQSVSAPAPQQGGQQVPQAPTGTQQRSQ
jgi:hypothetical protein